MMILIWLIIGFGIYYLVTNKPGYQGKQHQDPVEILKLRYINGEIDDETYKRYLSLLKA